MIFVCLYFLSFLAIAVLSRFMPNREARRIFQLVTCFLLLFVFFGFRDITVLNDTSIYYGNYYQLSRYKSYLEGSVFSSNPHERFEYGYQVIIHFLIKYISKDPYTIIWLSSLVITVGNLWFIKHYTDDIALVTFFMMISGQYFLQYCIIRQAFAILIFYIAFHYLENDKTLKYCLLVLLASIFHSSAVFLLLVPLLKRLTINTRNISIMFIVTIAIGLLILHILSILGLTDNQYFKKAMERETTSLAAIFDILMMAIILLTCVYTHWKMRIQTIDKSYFWICMFAMCICLITPTFYILQRINLYIWPIIIIQLFRYVNPDYTFKMGGLPQQSLRRFLQLFIILVFLTKTLGVMTLRPEWSHVVPYSFYDFRDTFHYYNYYNDTR